MRVAEPMLSIVAIRRSADSRSGAKVPGARHAPLNSVNAGDEAQDFGGDLEGVGLNPVVQCDIQFTHSGALLSGDACSLWVVAERIMRTFSSA